MSDSIINFLLRECKSGDPDRQFQAIIQIMNLKLIEAIPILVKLLFSADPQVRASAVRALSSLGEEQIDTIAPMFVKKLEDPDELVRCDLIDSLAEFCYEPAIEKILLLLHSDPSYLVRSSAAEALVDIAHVGDKEVLTALENALNDSDESVRAYSAFAIGLLGNSECLSTIKEHAKKEDSVKVKAKLFAVACRLGDKTAIENLLNLLDEKEEEPVFVVINTFKQLAEESPPKSLTSNVVLIQNKLFVVRDKFPSLANEVDTTLEIINLINWNFAWGN